MTDCTTAKLSSMHFYGWKLGLKTGMYYLRTKAAADAIKFTVDVATANSKETAKAPQVGAAGYPAGAAASQGTPEPEVCLTCSA